MSTDLPYGSLTTNTRLDRNEYFMEMARLVSLRGACIRRKVGCVLTNNLNHVIATGYNGRARGVSNCLELPCNEAQSASGENLEKCEAIHAEQNALLQCQDVEQITIAYCTASPCIHCTKLLMNTSCHTIMFYEEYPGHEQCEKLWKSSDPFRKWVKVSYQVQLNLGM